METKLIEEVRACLPMETSIMVGSGDPNTWRIDILWRA